MASSRRGASAGSRDLPQTKQRQGDILYSTDPRMRDLWLMIVGWVSAVVGLTILFITFLDGEKLLAPMLAASAAFAFAAACYFWMSE